MGFHVLFNPNCVTVTNPLTLYNQPIALKVAHSPVSVQIYFSLLLCIPKIFSLLLNNSIFIMSYDNRWSFSSVLSILHFSPLFHPSHIDSGYMGVTYLPLQTGDGSIIFFNLKEVSHRKCFDLLQFITYVVISK